MKTAAESLESSGAGRTPPEWPSLEALAPPEGFAMNPWRVGFDHAIGPLFARALPDGTRIMGLRVTERHVNGRNNIHGGMLASMADIAWGQPLAKAGFTAGWATVKLTTYFVAAAPLGSWVEAGGELVSSADDLFTVHGRVWCAERTLLTGTAIYKGFRTRG